MSIKDKDSIKLARNVGVAWTIIGYIGATTIGFIGLAIFGPNALADVETVMPEVMMESNAASSGSSYGNSSCCWAYINNRLNAYPCCIGII